MLSLTYRSFLAPTAWLVVVAGLVAGLYGITLMSRSFWPGLHDDAVLFSTPLMNRVATGENHFNVYTPFLVGRDNQTVFNWHGQLYNAVVAPLLGSPDYASLLVLLNRANALGFLLAFVVYFLAARRYCRWPAWGAATLGLAAAYAVLAILVYLQGRPDHGIPFAFLFFSLIRVLAPAGRLPFWGEGILIGTFAAISPLVGAVYALAVFFLAGLRDSSVWCYVCEVAGASLVAIGIYLVLSALAYDGSVWELVIGTLHGYQEPFRFDLGHLVPFWLSHRMLPGVAMPIIIAAALASGLLWLSLRRSEYRRAALLSLLPLFALAFVFVRQGILFAPHYYTFVALVPAAAWWTLEETVEMRHVSLSAFVRAMPLAVTLSLAVVGLGAVRSFVLQPSVMNSSPSYTEALHEARALADSLPEGEVVGIHQYLNSRSPVVLAGPPWKFRTHAISEPLAVTEEAERKLGFRVSYYFSLQHQYDPPAVEGFELVKDRYSRTPATLFGLRLLSYSPGYGYAIYRRRER